MWLLEGRFAEDSRQELSKLLKYGQTYTLGRKIPADIVIDSKFVSRVSCHITVASEDTVTSQVSNVTDALAFHNDISLRPRVTIRFEANKSRKTFGVTQQPRRSGSTEPTEVQVPADQEHILQDGDSFALTTTISLRLVWKPMAVCFAAKVKETAISPFRQAALKLGIYLSPAKSRWRDGYTHLCLIQVKPTESVLCALLQARPIVTIDYFTELFRRAHLPRHDPASLETSFTEPDLTTYQPTIDQQELSEIPDMPAKLLPEERRTHMLKGTTCVFFALPAEEGELSIYKSILSVAGAHVFTHNPQAEGLRTKADFAQLLMPYKNSALSYWRNSGSKARSEAPDEGLVVLVGAVHDGEAWKEGCAVACRNLRIAMPSGFHAITNAVFAGDVRAHLNTTPSVGDAEEGEANEAAAAAPPAAQEESVADVTAAEMAERSPARPEAVPTRTEVAEPAPSAPAAMQPPAPAAEPSSTASEPQKRPLTRRTRKPADEADARNTPEANASIDVTMDTSGSASRSLTRSTEAGAELSSSQLTRAERSGLTRRTGASRATHRRSDVFDAILRPDAGQNIDAGGGSASVSTDAGAGSFIPKSKRFRMDLDEEDRAQTQITEASQVQESVETGKRKSLPQQPSAADDQRETSNSRASKRTRTTAPEPEPEQPEPEPARVIRNDATNDHAGLSKGAQPDSEPQFLQALNTQRAKGKKMDEFDADFNRLQIAKPSTQSTMTLSRFRNTQQRAAGNGGMDQDYEAFKAMAEEELRIHVRGNFVQVDFVPLVRQQKDVQQVRDGSGRGGRGDVPNFKKFRGKANGGSAGRGAGGRQRGVAMVLPESNDYGLGQSYWDQQQEGSKSVATSRGGRKASRQMVLSDEETNPRPPKSKTRVALDPASVEESAINLDLDSMDSDDDDGADMTSLLRRQHGPRSQPKPTPASRGRKRPAALVADSDEEMPTATTARASASGGRKKQVTATTGRSPTMLFDDDQDDSDGEGGDGGNDGNFAGFGRSTSTRRRRVDPAGSSVRTRRSVF